MCFTARYVSCVPSRTLKSVNQTQKDGEPAQRRLTIESPSLQVLTDFSFAQVNAEGDQGQSSEQDGRKDYQEQDS